MSDAPMDPEQSYKYGFMLRCAEEGLDEAGAEARAKEAFSLMDLIQNLGTAGVVGTAGAGLVAGAAGARMLQPSFRPQDLQRKEEADLYASFADDLERKNRADLGDREGA